MFLLKILTLPPIKRCLEIIELHALSDVMHPEYSDTAGIHINAIRHKLFSIYNIISQPPAIKDRKGHHSATQKKPLALVATKPHKRAVAVASTIKLPRLKTAEVQAPKKHKRRHSTAGLDRESSKALTENSIDTLYGSWKKLCTKINRAIRYWPATSHQPYELMHYILRKKNASDKTSITGEHIKSLILEINKINPFLSIDFPSETSNLLKNEMSELEKMLLNFDKFISDNLIEDLEYLTTWRSLHTEESQKTSKSKKPPVRGFLPPLEVAIPLDLKPGVEPGVIDPERRAAGSLAKKGVDEPASISMAITLLDEVHGFPTKNRLTMKTVDFLDSHICDNPDKLKAAVNKVAFQGLEKLQERMGSKCYHTYLHALEMMCDCIKDFKLFGDMIAIRRPALTRVLYALIPNLALYHDIVQNRATRENEQSSGDEFVDDFVANLKDEGIELPSKIIDGLKHLTYRIIVHGTHIIKFKELEGLANKREQERSGKIDVLKVLYKIAGTFARNDTRRAANEDVQMIEGAIMLQKSRAEIEQVPPLQTLAPAKLGLACLVMGQSARIIGEGSTIKSDSDRALYRHVLDEFKARGDFDLDSEIKLHILKKGSWNEFEAKPIPIWQWLPTMVFLRDIFFHVNVNSDEYLELTGLEIPRTEKNAWAFFNKFYSNLSESGASITFLVRTYLGMLKNSDENLINMATKNLKLLTKIILTAATTQVLVMPDPENLDTWVGVDASQVESKKVIEAVSSYAFRQIEFFKRFSFEISL